MTINSINVQSRKWPSPHELPFNSGQSYRTYPEWFYGVKNEPVHFDSKPKPSRRSSAKRTLMKVLRKLVRVFQWKQSSQISCQGQPKDRLLDIHRTLSSGKDVATVIVNGKAFKDWKILKTPVNDDWAVKKFIDLNSKAPKTLDPSFVVDIGRAEYIINGEIIPIVMDASSNIDQLAMISEFEKRIPDDLQRQLVSVYANQEIFVDVATSTHNMDYAAINSGTLTYNINKSSDGSIKIIAESQKDFRHIDDFDLHPNKIDYSQLLRAEVTIPVPDKGAPRVQYYYSKT